MSPLRRKDGSRWISVAVPRGVYGDESVRVAALVFSTRAKIVRRAAAGARKFSLHAPSPPMPGVPQDLAGEFMNELLNQEYRSIVARFNRRAADFVATQALLAARGGEKPVSAQADPPELAPILAALLETAREQLRKTTPKGASPEK